MQPDHWANLLWAIRTPDIVRGGGLPWLQPRYREELTGYFCGAGIATRLAPRLDDEMRTADARRPARRLGVYFENLWAFAFTHHPHYELLYRNLPLRAGGRTLGELDFVVRHQPSGCTEHWEIAVKFYLRATGASWVGPGLRDRLDSKLARMREHQLPLIRRPAAAEILQRHNIHIDRQWALMPGRLFRPFDDGAGPLHPTINPDACRYWWAPVDEYRRHFAGRALRWIRLGKRAWLADRGYRPQHGDSCDALAGELRQEKLRSPVCVAALSAGREVSRGFIVPDDWHAAAIGQISQAVEDGPR